MSRLGALVGLASVLGVGAAPHLRNELNSALEGARRAIRTPDAKKDRILKLPGLNYEPTFDMFSGYLTVSENGRHLFYWFVESQGDAATDPVVLWTNGGPGCSGFLGLGTEHGPFLFHKNETLTANPHSWNKVASILYVEQPAGVGFSYSDTKDDYNTGDSKAAIDNYELIRQFLTRFPERKANEFYISSESYGGHYMPQLTMEILNRNTDGFINFKGFMVGNPYVDPFTNTLAQFSTFYTHGLLTKPLYDKFLQKCSTPKELSSSTCYDLQTQMRQEFGDGINPYALDFPVCTEQEETKSPKLTSSSQVKTLLNHTLNMGGVIKDGPPFLPQQDEYYPCEEEHLQKYMNRWGVQTALHAHVGSKWKACSDIIHYSWSDVNTPQINLFEELVKMGKSGSHQLNILVFSGDDDSVCSTTGTQEWIYKIGMEPKKNEMWQPWEVAGQTAGFVTKFDMGNNAKASFTFVTVHGAGHEVPAYRPMEALELFKRYLKQNW